MLARRRRPRAVVTAEDGVRDGGIGMTIADRIGSRSRRTSPSSVLGLPTRFIAHAATPEEILGGFGLDHVGLITAIRGALA